MSYWTVDKWNGSGWDSDDPIPRPNANFPVPTLSTQVEVPLADGDFGYISNEVKYKKTNVITFLWIKQTEAFRDQIDDWITGHEYLRITNHLSGTYIGRFISSTPVWQVGEEDNWDITANFQIME